MFDSAFYPAVALVYFFGVMQGTKDNRLDLPRSCSVNVFCLFILMQPLCLMIGSYTGMLTYLITAIVSYNCLHWKDPENNKQEKPESAEEKKKVMTKKEKRKKTI